MNSISIASTIAMAVGLAAALPQIARMLSTRSANGQSMIGWAMGLLTNCAMAYVNLAGFGALFLAASNALSGSLCIVAMVLIARFGRGAGAETDALAELEALQAREARAARIAGTTPQPAAAARGPRAAGYVPSHHTLVDMPTMELVALRTALDEAHAVRAERRDAQLQAA